MKNKKGQIPQQLLTIVLVILVLVVLFFGLWQAIKGPGNKFLGDKDNVGLVIQQCKVACLSGISDEYCVREREVYSPDESFAGKRTCKYLESKSEDLDCRDSNLRC